MLAQVETDKATMDMESSKDGYLAKILVKEGTAEIALGQVNDRRYLRMLIFILYILLGGMYYCGEQRGCRSF